MGATWSSPFSGQVDPGWKVWGIAFLITPGGTLWHIVAPFATWWHLVAHGGTWWHASDARLTWWHWNSFVVPSSGSSTVIVTSLLNIVTILLQTGSSFQIVTNILKARRSTTNQLNSQTHMLISECRRTRDEARSPKSSREAAFLSPNFGLCLLKHLMLNF